MTAPKPNAELAYRTLELIRANPEHFNMTEWSDSRLDKVGLKDLTAPPSRDADDADLCGTTACFAGWAIALSGYMVTSCAVLTADGKVVVSRDVQDFAATLLGIEYTESEYLFYVENEEIDEAVEAVFGPRPEPAS